MNVISKSAYNSTLIRFTITYFIYPLTYHGFLQAVCLLSMQQGGVHWDITGTLFSGSLLGMQWFRICPNPSYFLERFRFGRIQEPGRTKTASEPYLIEKTWCVTYSCFSIFASTFSALQKGSDSGQSNHYTSDRQTYKCFNKYILSIFSKKKKKNITFNHFCLLIVFKGEIELRKGLEMLHLLFWASV
ncbi:hypothetical protein XELAEV_18008393mg [Xenopus laevis]|uniref:Uncharacterized protein n=1 Tax=Xenopus laevis TaxID=8355 RepID=A0A974E2W8_XENLA|nr:hypothetical protein XELAEV_18008393mg [Xenopus laevis]